MTLVLEEASLALAYFLNAAWPKSKAKKQISPVNFRVLVNLPPHAQGVLSLRNLEKITIGLKVNHLVKKMATSSFQLRTLVEMLAAIKQ